MKVLLIAALFAGQAAASELSAELTIRYCLTVRADADEAYDRGQAGRPLGLDISLQGLRPMDAWEVSLLQDAYRFGAGGDIPPTVLHRWVSGECVRALRLNRR